jgi:hypothetical protein
LGTSDFRAGDEQRRIGRRSKDTEKEERFLAHTSDTSCLTCAFSLHKDDVTVYMFLPKQNKKPLTNARAKRLKPANPKAKSRQQQPKDTGETIIA